VFTVFQRNPSHASNGDSSAIETRQKKVVAGKRRYCLESFGKKRPRMQILRNAFVGQSTERAAKTFFAPFMIHEALPTLTETAFGSHPCCVVSVTYLRTHRFHGGSLSGRDQLSNESIEI
jgi:hypothetical protein